MKKKILNIVLAAAVTPFLCCCTDNFEEYNTNLWRANLCATFLGNLVYPTPASKMLHFP